MAKDWTKDNARSTTRGLKKTGANEWFDPKSRALFTKEKGKLKMKIDEWDVKQHKRTMERFRYYENKFGIDLSNEKKAEKDRWDYYRKMVNDFNTGEIKRPETVQRRAQRWEKQSFKKGRYYSPENTQLKAQIEETKKVTLLRMMGKHGVYNGRAYDAMVEGIARALHMSKEDLEGQIFPKLQQEKSVYDNLEGYIDNAEKSLTDLVEQLVANETITENEGEHALKLFNETF